MLLSFLGWRRNQNIEQKMNSERYKIKKNQDTERRKPSFTYE